MKRVQHITRVSVINMLSLNDADILETTDNHDTWEIKQVTFLGIFV